MKLVKIFNKGNIINDKLYEKLQELDFKIFAGCNNEFKDNRDWWIIVDKNKHIIAYCGCLYSEGVCIFVRAWVHRDYRGKGLQRKMIKARIRAAKNNNCKSVITYTTIDNVVSANNLIKTGFLLYEPSYRYVGNDVLYFKYNNK